MGRSIEDSIKYLEDFDSYSPYQEALEKVCAYIKKSQMTEKKMKKIKMILDTDVAYEHLRENMKLDAIKRVVDGDMQEDKFWKFIDEV